MDFASAVKNVLNNYATFDGRARRSEYWFWYLAVVAAYFVGAIIASVIDALLGFPLFTIVLVIAMLGLVVPTIAVAARRLHDTDKSGWFQLIGLIPFLGAIVLIVFYATDSGPDNQYGPNPKGAAPGFDTPPPAPPAAPPAPPTA